MFTPDEAQILTEEGYTIREMCENPRLFDELLTHLNEARLPDAVLTNVTYVTRAMVRDGVTRIEVLKWLLAHSDYLGEMPIRYLMQTGFRAGGDAIVMAADAHFSTQPRAERGVIDPAPSSNVVPLAVARERRRRAR